MPHCAGNHGPNRMALSGKQKRYLRSLGQQRKSVVTVGTSGLSAAALTEIRVALAHHELMKVKLPALNRALREQLLRDICQATGADLIQLLGRVGLIYLPANEPVIKLP